MSKSIQSDILEMVGQAESLGMTEIDIAARGIYPESKKGTKVQHVAKWQNDGTSRGISPSYFVERAEARAGDWNEDIKAAIIDTIDGNFGVLENLGIKIAWDINRVCDRIKTGRLKRSMIPIIKKK